MKPSSSKNLVKPLLAMLSLTLLPQNMSQAQTIELTANTDRKQIQIADPFEFQIKLTAPFGTKVVFPGVGEQIGSFDVMDVQDQFGVLIDGVDKQRSWTRTLTLETIVSGKLQIPRIEISVQPDKGVPKLFRTDPVEVTVASVVEPSSDLTRFNDIADLVDVDTPKSSSPNIAWVSVAGVIVLALGLGCLVLVKRSRSSVSARDWAMAQLNGPSADDFSRLEGIVRNYIEERFEFPAASLTSAVVSEQLLALNVDQHLVSKVDEIFAVSEQVKFAGVQISTENKSRLFENARTLITELDQQATKLSIRPKEVT